MQRGKFRPRLQQLVASNSKDTVEKCSRKAFSLLPDVQAAIAELTSLRGVGPATASGAHMLCIQAERSRLKNSHSQPYIHLGQMFILFQLCWQQEPQKRLHSCLMKARRACRD